MSKKVIRVNLSEITTARVRCKACEKGITEVPVAILGNALSNGKCRFCAANIMEGMQNPYPLDRLGTAIQALLQMESKIDVEIEIPFPS